MLIAISSDKSIAWNRCCASYQTFSMEIFALYHDDSLQRLPDPWPLGLWAATRASISDENRVNVGQICHTARQAAACGHWPRTPCPAAGRPGRICRIVVKTLGPPSAGLGPTVTVCGVRFRKDTLSAHCAQPFEGTYLLVQPKTCFGNTSDRRIFGFASSFMAIRSD